MSTTLRLRAARGASLAGALLLPAAARAQLPNASAAAFALGSYVGAARGADAVAWNPANLALPGGPAFSLRALAGGGVSGLAPISWSDVSGWGDQTLPVEVRTAWLARVSAAGRQTGAADGGATALALSAGRFGLHVGASGYTRADLAPDAIEALLFGNAGRTGEPRDLSFAGSQVRGGAFGTTAVSYAQPVGGRASVGVTAKYVLGAAVLRAEDGGSAVTTREVAVRFPAVYSAAGSRSSGSGYGVDLGAAWTGSALTLGAAVENVVNTFAWRGAALRYRAGAASFDGTTSSSDFDERAFAEAPHALRDAVAAERFAPALAAGAAWRRGDALLVTADARRALGGDDAIVVGPRTHVGAGVESRLLRVLPVRAGAALVGGGYRLSAGAGLRLGGFELAAAYALRRTEHGSAPGAMLNLVSVH